MAKKDGKNKSNKKGKGGDNVENVDELLLSGTEVENNGDKKVEVSDKNETSTENVVVDFDGNQLPEATLNVAEAVKEIETDGKKDKKEKKEKNDSSQKPKDDTKASEKTEENVSSEEIEISPEDIKTIVDKIVSSMGIDPSNIPNAKIDQTQKTNFLKLFEEKMVSVELDNKTKKVLSCVMPKLLDTGVIALTVDLITASSEDIIKIVKKDIDPVYKPLLDNITFVPSRGMDIVINSMMSAFSNAVPDNSTDLQERLLNKIGFTNKRVGKYLEKNPEREEDMNKFLDVLTDLVTFAEDPVQVINSITKNMCNDGFPSEFIFATKVGL